MCDRPSATSPEALEAGPTHTPDHLPDPAVRDALERIAMELARAAGRPIPDGNDWDKAYQF